jgi:hypothetical protein
MAQPKGRKNATKISLSGVLYTIFKSKDAIVIYIFGGKQIGTNKNINSGKTLQIRLPVQGFTVQDKEILRPKYNELSILLRREECGFY